MEEIKGNGILIRDIKTKNIMTKSTLPVGGYSVTLMLAAPTAVNTAMLLS